MSAADRFRATADRFTGIVDSVQDWDAPTPVKEWTARDIVGHFTSWVPPFLQDGAGIDLEPGPDPADDPVAAWTHLRDQVQAVLDDPASEEKIYTSSMLPEMPLPQVVDQFVTADVVMHGWDLARSAGQDYPMDEGMVRAMHEGMAAMGPMLRESGQFGQEQPVDDDASAQDRFIAFIGRDPSWQPPAEG